MVRANFSFASPVVMAGVPPPFRADGVAFFKYPCLLGDTINASATADISIPGFEVDAFGIGVVFFCEVGSSAQILFTLDYSLS